MKQLLILPIIAVLPTLVFLINLILLAGKSSVSKGWCVVIASLSGGFVTASEWLLFEYYLESRYAREGAFILLFTIIGGAGLLVLDILLGFLWWRTTKCDRR